MQDVLDRFGDVKYELDELGGGEEKGPFQNVLSLECEQMNRLLLEVHRSLIELGVYRVQIAPAPPCPHPRQSPSFVFLLP